MAKTGSLQERHQAKIDTSGDCWLWTAAVDGGGYGVIQRGSRGEGLGKAHRLAWEFAFGPIPDGLIVCHACDTPACCNPTHLFLGTHADNAHDRDAKGRTQRYRAAWTHCKHGHPFTEETTYVRKDGRRQCRQCPKEKGARHRKAEEH